MDIISRINRMKEISKEARGKGKKIGFVPTMGFLHEGHLSLFRRARELSDITIASIFVNPAQFGPAEDFDKYPRDLARDVDLTVAEGVDYLFTPAVEEVYPEGYFTYVEVKRLSDTMCGRSRPGHFRGVTTIVLKLFNIVLPSFAILGQKDAQQAIIIKKMVKDLNMNVEIVVAPTVRHEDGLAMSSRNYYLSMEERKAATILYRSLIEAQRLINDGEKDAEAIEIGMRKLIEDEPLARIDYISITDTAQLEHLSKISGEVLIALAVFIGNTRLIDNIIVNA
ncbi:MAG: pantoate--beta-alanine ligase [Acidobacteriota bacterium]